jgi:tetratricopeptide (TPR) repeat protein
MSFDKIKAMRNAERFLAQGKIRAAINEYKRVVESDPKDFSTLNMLGDLYAKASDTQEAVKCFTHVAEHYGKQGFSQKAIAIYNKISRLSPESLEISAKLAELYQMKGSVAEARSHYTTLAEQYERKGNKAEALSVLKQIAQLDLNNTEIHLKIADACLKENQADEAATAFIEAGLRLSAKKQYEPAITALSRGLEIRPNDLTGLKGVVKAQISLGYTDEAAKTLEKVLESEPFNREVIFLLVDCYLDTNNPQKAEKAVIQLVEREPSNYLKLLDVVQSYLKEGDLDSATRILSMTSEHLLVGGQAEELGKWINEILARNPEQPEALRLLVRLHGWLRDEPELKDALERLLEVARLNELVEDERYALTQLVLMMPHEVSFAKRLQEINEIYGYTEVPLDYQPHAQEQPEFSAEALSFESFALTDTQSESTNNSGEVVVDYTQYMPEVSNGNGSANGLGEFLFVDETLMATVVEDGSAPVTDFQTVGASDFSNNLVGNDFEDNTFTDNNFSSNGSAAAAETLEPYEEARLQQELESVEFYITQGFTDLAVQSLDLLESEFGNRPQIEQFRQKLPSPVGVAAPDAPETSFAMPETSLPLVEEEIKQESAPEPVTAETPLPETKSFDVLDEFRSELGLEEPESEEDHSDHETHYHLGIAYKEMGLMEDSIREFQEAVKLVSPNDGTRRFFLCCNLLGHCFMEKQMPNLALTWYKRCLETANLDADERQGLRYEVANAYEAGGDTQKAIQYFEEIYAENVDYRDIVDRIKYLKAQ